MFSISLASIPKDEILKREYLTTARELELSESFRQGSVQIAVELARREKNALARGSASASAQLQCARCLKSFECQLTAPFLVEFKPVESFERHLEDLPNEEEDSHFSSYQGDHLPLGEEIRQELELAVPFQAFCRPDCKGLCKSCGSDLNLGPCACPPESIEGPFAHLKDLLQ